MNVLAFVYITPLFLSAALGMILTWFISRNRLTPSSIALVVLILGASFWSFGYALEFLSPILETKLFWARFQYFGITTVPLAWFIFTFRYIGAPGWVASPLKYRALLAVVPVVTLALVWTNEFHHLIWQSVSLYNLGSMSALEYNHGPAFWVYFAYSYALILAGTIKLLSGLINTYREQRRQFRLALVGVIVPWIANLVYITKLNPIPFLDWTPFAFSVAGTLFTISLFRYRLVEILPIAEKAIFSGLPDCLLVFDAQDCLVDMNLAAEKMMGNTARALAGRPLPVVIPDLAGQLSLEDSDREIQVEITLGQLPDQHYHELRMIPLHGPYKQPVGRLVVYHEITPHIQQQAILEKAVAERTQDLQRAVDQLQDELAQRAQAERRFEEIIESAPDAMLLISQDGVIQLANAQAERLFGYTRQELIGRDFELLIPPRRREPLQKKTAQMISLPAQGRSRLSLESTVLHKDGNKLPVEISLSSLETADNTWITCNIRDISQRIAAEQAQNRLLQEIRQSHQQMQALAFHLQEVQEHERHHIARELHDRVGQNLTGLNLSLKILQNQLDPSCSPESHDRLVDSLKLVEETTRQVRDVLADLHPPMLDEFGLVVALRQYASIFGNRIGIETRVNGSEIVPHLAVNVELVLFRLIQEALNNAAKHAHASQVTIQIQSGPEEIFLSIQDDGIGFDSKQLSAPADQPHWGIIDMQQRVESIGAQLSIHSEPGQGTRVSITYRR